MLYQYTKRYLKKRFYQPSSNFVWSKEINSHFFEHIDKRYAIEEFEKELTEVKEAFKDFFEPVGNLIFKYRDKREIVLKIFPYRVNPAKSKHLDRLIKIILQNKEYVKYHNNKKDSLVIFGKIRREINKEIYHTDESVNKKELVKCAIRKALELDERDIIVTLKRKFIVKKFKIFNISFEPDDSNEIAGYTKDEVEDSYKKIFKDDNLLMSFIQNTLKKLFNLTLNFVILTNEEYEKNFARVVHRAIVEELDNYISVEEDFRVAIAIYLMQENARKIHRIVAIELLNSIYENEKNAIDFLSYYDGRYILKNNIKYKTPRLETKDGKSLHVSNIINICNLWINDTRKRDKLEDELKFVEKMLQQNIKISNNEREKLYKRKRNIESSLKEVDSSINAKKSQVKPMIDSIISVLMQKTVEVY